MEERDYREELNERQTHTETHICILLVLVDRVRVRRRRRRRGLGLLRLSRESGAPLYRTRMTAEMPIIRIAL